MATFDDILHDAQPAIQYGQNAVEQEATEGRDWYWWFEIGDALGVPIDLEALGITGECEVYDRPGMATVTTLDVDIDGSIVTLTKSDTDTAGLAAGERIRRCAWRFTLTETATGRSCDVWGVRDSSLAIRQDD